MYSGKNGSRFKALAEKDAQKSSSIEKASSMDQVIGVTSFASVTDKIKSMFCDGKAQIRISE